MKTRTLAIVLGATLAVSVGVNLFAVTAAVTALREPPQVEKPREEAGHRPSARELIARLSPEARAPVRAALRAAAQRARPHFQASRQARQQAIEAAAVQPMDAAQVTTLLARSQAAEAVGRQLLEADAVTILGTLDPADRVILAQILNGRDRGGRDRREPTASAPRPST